MRSISLPVVTSIRRVVLSLLPVARYLLSGLNSTALTQPWWRMRSISLPVVTSIRRAVPLLRVARYLLSGLNSTASTVSSWLMRAIKLGSKIRLLRKARSASNGTSSISGNRLIDSAARNALVSYKSGYWLPILSDVAANWRANALLACSFALLACLFASIDWKPAKIVNPAKMTEAMEVTMSCRFLRSFSCLSRRLRHSTLVSINLFSSSVKPPIFWKASFSLKSTTRSNLEPFKSSSLALAWSLARIFCHRFVSPASQFLRIIASFSSSIQPFNLSQEDSKISWAISTVADCFEFSLSLICNFSELKSSALLTSKFSLINVWSVFCTDSPTNSLRLARLLTVLFPESVSTILTNLTNICLVANCSSWFRLW